MTRIEAAKQVEVQPKFARGQAVTLRFDDGASYPATVIENIDAVCRPLTDMWRVRIEIDGKPGATFGFHGSHIDQRQETQTDDREADYCRGGRSQER